MDITPYILMDLTKLFKEEQVVYAGQGIGDDLLKMIRADEGVQSVECDYYAHMASEL
jgi:soluble P-type ATPase